MGGDTCPSFSHSRIYSVVLTLFLLVSDECNSLSFPGIGSVKSDRILEEKTQLRLLYLLGRDGPYVSSDARRYAIEIRTPYKQNTDPYYQLAYSSSYLELNIR